jgi:copper(I)-binding protein
MEIRMRPPLVVAAWLALSLPAAAQVTVADPWVRGIVGGQRATGAFMTLTAGKDSALVAAASPVAKIVEIHESKVENGVMQMRAVQRIDLPAGKPVALKPGGLHVMLMALTQPLPDGSAVPITLTFEDRDGKRTTAQVSATVRPLAQKPH